jgi:hypothetical protein
MTPPLPALRDFSDRLSPMVVKEMRQGLRTRFFTAALILFHVVLGCLMLSFLGALNQDEYTHEMFWLVIIFTLLGVLPSRAFNALNTEVKDGTLDMLMLTGITSFRIVWGKWVSLYSQTLLVASSLLPYMIVRYQFGGVEIAREVLALAVLVVGSGLVTAALIGFSSQRLMFVRLLMSATVGAGAFFMGVFAHVLSCEDYGGQEIMQDLVSAGEVAATLLILGITVLAAYLSYLFLCLGSARLALVRDSQTIIKRVLAFLMLLFITGLAVVLGSMGYGQWVIVAVAYMPAMLLVLLVTMDLATEELPVMAGSSRTWLLQPGWAAGVGTACLLWVVPFLILFVYEWLTPTHSTRWDEEPWFITLGLMAASVVPVCLPIFHRHSRLTQWWAIQILMLTAAVLLVVAMEVMTYGDREGWGFLGLLFPVSSMFGAEAAPGSEEDTIRALGFFTHAAWIIAALVLASKERRRQLSQTHA